MWSSVKNPGLKHACSGPILLYKCKKFAILVLRQAMNNLPIERRSVIPLKLLGSSCEPFLLYKGMIIPLHQCAGMMPVCKMRLTRVLTKNKSLGERCFRNSFLMWSLLCFIIFQVLNIAHYFFHCEVEIEIFVNNFRVMPFCDSLFQFFLFPCLPPNLYS